MVEGLRTLLLAGVGAIDLGEESVREVAADLVRRGELVADEARALADAYAVRIRARRERDVAAITTLVAEALAQQNVASQASIVALEDRLSAIERTIAELRAGQVASQ